MKGIDKAFANHTHIEKVRIAKFVKHAVTSTNADITAHNGMMNTVLALLAKGEMNCAGEQAPEKPDLFSDSQRATPKPTEQQQQARPASEPGQGVVQTAQKTAHDADYEQRRRKAEEAAIKDAGVSADAPEADAKKDGKTGFKKAWAKTKAFIKGMVAEE